MTHNFGLKLFSTNVHVADEAKRLVDSGLFHYIELYAVPESYDESITVWEKLLPSRIEIHAPHHRHGFNPSVKDLRQTNLLAVRDARRFADAFDSRYIIVHGGNSGTLEETFFQIDSLNDSRFILENIPFVGVDGQKCVGQLPSEMKLAVQHGPFCGFVLDIGHAVLAANYLGVDSKDFISEMIRLAPCIYHVMDGFAHADRDVHLHLGEGDYDLEWVIPNIPTGALVTLETPLNLSKGLADHTENLLRYKKILAERCHV